MKLSTQRKLALWLFAMSVSAAGFPLAHAGTPQPATNEAAAKAAATVDPATPVYYMTDVTARVEKVDHALQIESGLYVLANYLPPYIAPYSKTRDQTSENGFRFNPDLCTMGKPEKPFLLVMPGAIEKIVTDKGDEVSLKELESLKMWALALDGDGEKTASTAFALRVQMPEKLWKPSEVRGYVLAVVGSGTEWVDLGQVDFKNGGQASNLGFQFKDVVVKGNTASFTAIADPRVWMVRSEITVGDENKPRLGNYRGEWNPSRKVARSNENLAGYSTFTIQEGSSAPSSVHVKAQVIKNPQLVRVPFVFVTGPDEKVTSKNTSDGVAPKHGKWPQPGQVMYTTSVRVNGDPLPPKPAPPPPVAKAPAPAAAPAPKPASPPPQAAATHKPAPPPVDTKPKPKPAPDLPTVPTDLLAAFASGNLPKPAPAEASRPLVISYAPEPFAPSPEIPQIKSSSSYVAPKPAPQPTVQKEAPAPVAVKEEPAPVVETPAPASADLPAAGAVTAAPAAEPLKTSKKQGAYSVDEKADADALPEAGR